MTNKEGLGMCVVHGSVTLFRAGDVSGRLGYVRFEPRRRAPPRVGRGLSELPLSLSSVSRVKASWVGRFLEGKIAVEVLRVG